ncbi:MAG: hypothetical protein GY776_01735 [Alteromonas sp.]|nr:hypothetical protein [Alteromonas sp.]
MTKQIRRNAPAGAEYCSISKGETSYYKVREGEVYVWVCRTWVFVEWLDSGMLDGGGFHKIRRETWKEWVGAIVFALGFVTALGVVYG